MRKLSTECPLCEGQAEFDTDNLRDSAHIECVRCGHYSITIEAQEQIKLRDDLRPSLSAATREAWERRKPIALATDNFVSFSDAHRWTTVPEKARKVLSYLHARSSCFNQPVALSSANGYPLFDAVSPEECQALLGWLEQEKLALPEQGGQKYVLTMSGWEMIEPVHAGGIPGRCFVAMAFDKSLDDAYYKAIKPAVIYAGYEPVCMKERFTNDNICDVILAEIRKAQFVVADFTLQKGGVYFEAGFAKALGKEVFWSCQEDDFPNLHFDTNHYGHIKWTTAKDLKCQLEDRIVAELGFGIHKQRGGYK